MTDRHAAYIVTLADDIREDDAEAVLTALRMVSGVIAVTPVKTNTAQIIAQERRDLAWRQALIDFLRDGPAPR